MRRSAVAIVLLLCFCGAAFAQEECAEVEQAKAVLEKTLHETKHRLATTIRDNTEAVKALNFEIGKLNTDITLLKATHEGKIAQAQAGNDMLLEQAKRDCVVGMRQMQDDSDAKIAKLQQQLKNAKSFDFGSLTKAATDFANSSITQLKAVFEGLQKGDMTQLNALLISMHTSALSFGKATVELISAELDEHLPFVKKGVDDALAKAGALYQEHIGSATWFAEVSRQFSTANTELKAFIGAQVKAAGPTLAFLDDPVYVQLLAYMVLGAPLLLIFLPVLLWFATLLAPASKEGASASKSSKKKKGKSAGKPRA